MKKAVLLDLGNVVLGVDFRRVFKTWAASAGVDEQIFYDGWALDQAYKDHETGHIDFDAYTQALSGRFGVDLPASEWRRGWNDLWTEPFHTVIELLPAVADRYHLYGFTNTNDTHAACWRELFGHALERFAHIYVSSEIGLRKPDEAAYIHVCDHMSIAPRDVIFLDDTRENVEGAAGAGLDARHVKSEAAVAATLRALLE
jgi:putative hydrolase of the HAD superfamily